ANKAFIKFSVKGSFKSLSIIIVLTLIKEITFYIIPINTPFLFYLKDMDHIGIIFNNLKNTL
ncbi:hypothetical protein V8F20_012860, partial [Naviculisporaceae sp. PSN 640]